MLVLIPIDLLTELVLVFVLALALALALALDELNKEFEFDPDPDPDPLGVPIPPMVVGLNPLLPPLLLAAIFGSNNVFKASNACIFNPIFLSSTSNLLNIDINVISSDNLNLPSFGVIDGISSSSSSTTISCGVALLL